MPPGGDGASEQQKCQTDNQRCETGWGKRIGQGGGDEAALRAIVVQVALKAVASAGGGGHLGTLCRDAITGGPEWISERPRGREGQLREVGDPASSQGAGLPPPALCVFFTSHCTVLTSCACALQVPFLEKVLKVALQLALARVNRKSRRAAPVCCHRVGAGGGLPSCASSSLLTAILCVSLGRLKKGIVLPNIYNASLVHPQVTLFQVPRLATHGGLCERGVLVDGRGRWGQRGAGSRNGWCHSPLLSLDLPSWNGHKGFFPRGKGLSTPTPAGDLCGSKLPCGVLAAALQGGVRGGGGSGLCDAFWPK